MPAPGNALCEATDRLTAGQRPTDHLQLLTLTAGRRPSRAAPVRARGLDRRPLLPDRRDLCLGAIFQGVARPCGRDLFPSRRLS